ncbi:MAG: extracellular solute-binding protein [Bifidobacteriaceae bacterium]|nr:extracellular solute-binding protein [Bifidobacteriaceae bacterium]
MVAALSLVGLAACSDDSSSSDGGGGGDSTEATSGGDSSGDSGSTAEGVTNILLWHGYTEADGDVVQKIIDNFNASQSQYHVTAEQMAWSSIIEKLVTSLGSGDGPNAMVYGPDVALGYINQGAFISQQDYYDDTTTYKNQFAVYENLIDQVTWNGEIYGAPMGTAPYSVYYNTDLWAAAGLTDADIPTTIPELMEVAKKMTVDENGDGTPETYGFAIPDTSDNSIQLSTWLHSGGGDFITDGVAYLDSPENIATLEMLQKAVVEDKISPTGIDSTAAMELFGAGRAGMIFNGPWEITSAQSFGIPCSVFGWPGTWTAGVANYWWSTSMNDTPEEKAALYAFEDFWNSYEQQVIWTESYYPPNRGDIPQEEMAYEIIGTLSQYSEYAHFYMSGSAASLPDIAAEVDTLVSSAFKGGDVPSLLATAQEKITGYLNG